jgi:hypothetical protein
VKTKTISSVCPIETIAGAEGQTVAVLGRSWATLDLLVVFFLMADRIWENLLDGNEMITEQIE